MHTRLYGDNPYDHLWKLSPIGHWWMDGRCLKQCQTKISALIERRTLRINYFELYTCQIITFVHPVTLKTDLLGDIIDTFLSCVNFRGNHRVGQFNHGYLGFLVWAGGCTSTDMWWTLTSGIGDVGVAGESVSCSTNFSNLFRSWIKVKHCKWTWNRAIFIPAFQG